MVFGFWYLHAVYNVSKKQVSFIGQGFDSDIRAYLNASRLLSEHPLAVNMWTSPKSSLNLQKSIFILLFLDSEENWVRKSYFQLDLIYSDCLTTRWLETTSILVVIERIYRDQFKSNYLKNHRFLAIFFSTFGIYMKFPMLLKKRSAS